MKLSLLLVIYKRLAIEADYESSPGVVSEILVKDGEVLQAGAPLLRFDPDINEKRKAHP